MESALQERTVRVLNQIGPVSQHVPAEAVDELRRLVALAVREAARQERGDLHTTLRLCVAAFDEELHLASLRGMGMYVTVMDAAAYLKALAE